MTKVITSISIDYELKRKIKDKGLKMSRLVELGYLAATQQEPEEKPEILFQIVDETQS